MKPCPVDVWDSLAREDESATFFQTPAWHRIAARHFRAESAPLLFEFPDGPACLPLLRDRRWGRWRYFSPFGTYTAVVCPRTLTTAERAVIEGTLAPLNVHLLSSPFTHNPVTVGRTLPARSHVLDLATVDPDHVIKGWEKGQQRWSRVAVREGLTVRRAETSADWDAYYRLYEMSLARWGARTTTSYPASVFADIRDLPGGEAVRTLWLAERTREGEVREGEVGGEGAKEIGAGVLAFRHGGHMAVWHSAADARFFEAGATQLLYLHMIGDAVREGYAALDFLGSAGLKGVEDFKTRFGAVPRAYQSSLNQRGLVSMLANWKDRRHRS